MAGAYVSASGWRKDVTGGVSVQVTRTRPAASCACSSVSAATRAIAWPAKCTSSERISAVWGEGRSPSASARETRSANPVDARAPAPSIPVTRPLVTGASTSTACSIPGGWTSPS